MSPLADVRTLRVVAIALLLLVAWWLWDGVAQPPIGRMGDAATRTDLAACDAVEASAASESFRLGGQVVRARRWCDVSHVVVTASSELDDHERIVVVAASSAASLTLTLPRDDTVTVPIGPDGWLAVAVVQSSDGALARGGAWIRMSAGAPLR